MVTQKNSFSGPKIVIENVTGSGCVAQLEEHRAFNLMVVGSNPATPIIISWRKYLLTNWALHQKKERWLRGLKRQLAKLLYKNFCTMGSNPILSDPAFNDLSKKKKTQKSTFFFSRASDYFKRVQHHRLK